MPALYLHIPYCRQKCTYCDFFSVETAALPLSEYARLLLRHLELAAGKSAAQNPLTSIFFGGGTPSLLQPEAVSALIDAAAGRFGLAPDAEISLEANPGTVTPAKLAGFRAAGVNRLSLGIQTFDDTSLALLGRLHDGAMARQSLAWARTAGFTNLSCDLIFGLPGQKSEDLEKDLEILLEAAPDHLSCYGLTLEDGTPLAARHRATPLAMPDDEGFAGFYRLLDERLRGAGYGHYEISNFARPGRECRHNLGYWQRQPCLGLGAGAHSFDSTGWGRRLAVPPDLGDFEVEIAAGRDPAQVIETFDRRGAMVETLYLGLRTAQGVDEEAFAATFGCGVAEAFPEGVRRAGARLALADGYWRFDLAGWLLFDHLILPFF